MYLTKSPLSIVAIFMSSSYASLGRSLCGRAPLASMLSRSASAPRNALYLYVAVNLSEKLLYSSCTWLSCVIPSGSRFLASTFRSPRLSVDTSHTISLSHKNYKNKK